MIEFADGVHPTMATKITSGWIKKGMDKLISTTASRTRLNLFGSINLLTMSVTINQYKTINSDTLESHFLELKAKYKTANKIHLFFLELGGIFRKYRKIKWCFINNFESYSNCLSFPRIPEKT